MMTDQTVTRVEIRSKPWPQTGLVGLIVYCDGTEGVHGETYDDVVTAFKRLKKLYPGVYVTNRSYLTS